MVRHDALRGAILAFVAAALAVPVSAQTLGDAARRADEQRKQSTTPPMVITKLPDTPAESGPLRLSADVLQRYAEARKGLADLRRADRALHSRLYNGTKFMEHYDDLEPLLAREPDVVALLGSFRLTAADYVAIEAAIWRGKDYARYYRTLSMEALSKRDAENVEFVKANLWMVDEVWERCRAYEQGLKIWWGAIPSWR